MNNGEIPDYADLTPEQLHKIEELERDLGGVYVIAYEQPPVPAHLSDEQMERLQSAERELPGVVLVAYRKPKG
ncbi:MAG: hypothetical protein HY321_14485 [Armatimonadetes bacterium]|nr:hypothetical protein [Armatimonadota bacterium]